MQATNLDSLFFAMFVPSIVLNLGGYFLEFVNVLHSYVGLKKEM